MGRPGLPRQVLDLAGVRRLPFALAVLVALAAAGTLVRTLLLSVQSKRAELAILKTLGFTRGWSERGRQAGDDDRRRRRRRRRPADRRRGGSLGVEPRRRAPGGGPGGRDPHPGHAARRPCRPGARQRGSRRPGAARVAHAAGGRAAGGVIGCARCACSYARSWSRGGVRGCSSRWSRGTRGRGGDRNGGLCPAYGVGAEPVSLLQQSARRLCRDRPDVRTAGARPPRHPAAAPGPRGHARHPAECGRAAGWRARHPRPGAARGPTGSGRVRSCGSAEATGGTAARARPP